MKRMRNKISFVWFFLLWPSIVWTLNSSNWQLSPEGFGPIRIGMTLQQISKLTKKRFTATKPGRYEDKSCFTTTLKNVHLSGISFMISYDKVVRVNVTSKAFETSSGARIGDSEEKVKALYKNELLVENHRYEEQGHYLTYLDKPKNLALRFETNGKVITRMYAGKVKQVNYVEDCA